MKKNRKTPEAPEKEPADSDAAEQAGEAGDGEAEEPQTYGFWFRRGPLWALLCAAACTAFLLCAFPMSGSWPQAEALSAIAGREQSGEKIDLNTADREALCTLPAIGPARAQAILDWRAANGSFTSMEQLLEIPGFGEELVQELRMHCTLS